MTSCLVCYDDLDPTNSLQYFYNSAWEDAAFCLECTTYLRETKYKGFMEQFINSTCQKEQREMIKRGPPRRLWDRIGFPVAEEHEVKGLRMRANKVLVDHHLKDAPRGDDRAEKWDWMRSFFIENEPDED